MLAHMPTDVVCRLMDQARDMGYAGLVSFYLYSEPLLDKRSSMLAREARRRGLKPYLHTNGDLLRKSEALCREVRELYEYVVVGIYDYRSNEELEADKACWLDRLPGVDLRFSTIGEVGPRASRTMAVPRALVPTDGRMSIPDLTYSNAPCSRPLVRMIIRYDGEMCMCCEDVHAAFGLGNAYRSTLPELWYSERHRERVTQLLQGRRDCHPLCANCPQSPTGAALAGERTRMQFRRNAAREASLKPPG